MELDFSKKELETIQQALDSLPFEQDESLIYYLIDKYQKLTFPVANPKIKYWTKEQIFFHLIRPFDLLSYFYIRSLQQNNPAGLLNSFYSYNHINASFVVESGYDHCINFVPVIMCYAGNNYKLVESYLPVGTKESVNGHRFLVTGINLILALRDEIPKQYALQKAEDYLAKKNPKFDQSVINCLMDILSDNQENFKVNLKTVCDLHISSKWLNDFKNPIGKYLPYISYGLYSLANQYCESGEFVKVNIDSKIWWNGFQKMNIDNDFQPGRNVLNFPNELGFMNF